MKRKTSKRRKTISFDADVLAALEASATARRTTVSQIVNSTMALAVRR